MATYSDINGIKFIATGDEAGTWGTSTNANLAILERAANGFGQIALTGTSYTLPQASTPSSAEDGHYKAIEFTGTPGGTCTVTIEQNDHARVYMFLNSTNESITITQGSGGDVSIAASDGAIVLADGAGSGAQVTDLTAAFQTETASKLTTARNFSITGDVTAAAVSFDGTGNVALNAGITAGSIVDADISGSAAISDSKLAQITTSSKVANSATTATNSNTASTIVARDGSGNFSAGTITATLSGNASTASTATTLTGLTATVNELNIMDGGTSATSTTVAAADRVVFNDNGTMKQVSMSDIATYTSSQVTSPNNPTITLSAGDAITGGGSITLNQSGNETVTFNHQDTSSQSSVNNSNPNYIQDITLDDYGHVTAIGSASVASAIGGAGTFVGYGAGAGLNGNGNFNMKANTSYLFYMPNISSSNNVYLYQNNNLNDRVVNGIGGGGLYIYANGSSARSDCGMGGVSGGTPGEHLVFELT